MPTCFDEYADRMADILDRRLPRRDLLTVPEVAVAMDVDSKTVTNWVEGGEIYGVDTGTAARRRWRLERGSVLSFWRRRCTGERSPAGGNNKAR